MRSWSTRNVRWLAGLGVILLTAGMAVFGWQFAGIADTETAQRGYLAIVALCTALIAALLIEMRRRRRAIDAMRRLQEKADTARVRMEAWAGVSNDWSSETDAEDRFTFLSRSLRGLEADRLSGQCRR